MNLEPRHVVVPLKFAGVRRGSHDVVARRSIYAISLYEAGDRLKTFVVSHHLLRTGSDYQFDQD